MALTVPTPVSASAPLSATGSADIDHVVYAYSGDGGSTWTPIGTGNGPSPYGVTWTTPLTDGSYQVRATAFDGGGNQGTDVKSVQVDRTAPSGALTQPAAAATVGGANVSVAATASDPGGSGVASVTFRYRPTGGGAFTTIATDTTAPFATTWDVTPIASGSYDVQAVIVDAAGNTKLDLSTVTVDSTAPTPTAVIVGSAIRGAAPISITTSGDTTSATYAFDLAGGPVTWTQVGTSSTAPAFATTIDTTALADGVYDVRATVVDQFGNAATIVQSNVRVDNTAPSVVSSTPADGAVTASAASLTLTASEDIASITQLKLDGVAASFVAVAHRPVRILRDRRARRRQPLPDRLAARRRRQPSPFRLNVTIENGASTEQPERRRTSARASRRSSRPSTARRR